MTRAYRSTVIAAPLEEVWALVRDFSTVDRFVTLRDHSIRDGDRGDAVGCIRTDVLPSGDSVQVQLVALSDFDHRYSYRLLSSPAPIANYVAHVHLYPVSETSGTFIEWFSDFDVLEGGDANALVTFFEEGGYADLLKSIRQQAESKTSVAGSAHPPSA